MSFDMLIYRIVSYDTIWRYTIQYDAEHMKHFLNNINNIHAMHHISTVSTIK